MIAAACLEHERRVWRAPWLEIFTPPRLSFLYSDAGFSFHQCSLFRIGRLKGKTTKKEHQGSFQEEKCLIIQSLNATRVKRKSERPEVPKTFAKEQVNISSRRLQARKLVMLICEKALPCSHTVLKKWPFRLGQRRSSAQYCDLIQIFWINLEFNKGKRTKGVQYSIRAQPTLFDIWPTCQTLVLGLFQAAGVRSQKYIKQAPWATGTICYCPFSDSGDNIWGSAKNYNCTRLSVAASLNLNRDKSPSVWKQTKLHLAALLRFHQKGRTCFIKRLQCCAESTSRIDWTIVSLLI